MHHQLIHHLHYQSKIFLEKVEHVFSFESKITDGFCVFLGDMYKQFCTEYTVNVCL